MKDLVSIAVASHNNEKYLERCIDSTLSQTYDNCEIIVVDDGSNDSSLEVLNTKYSTIPNIRIISKANGGLSSSRQAAMENAKGKYICFIDADDYLDSRYVEIMHSKISKTGADVCVCSTHFEDESGNYLAAASKAYKCIDSDIPMQLSSDTLVNNNSIINLTLSDSWNKLYNLSFIKSTRVTFCLDRGYNGSDSVFNWKLAFHEPSYSSVGEELYFHVIYQHSAVRRKNKDLYKGFSMIINQMIAEANLLNKTDKLAPIISRQYFHYVRYASQDVFDESLGYLTKIQNVKKIRKSHDVYQYKGLLSKNIKKANISASLKLFVFIFRYTPIIEPLYLLIRKTKI